MAQMHNQNRRIVATPLGRLGRGPAERPRLMSESQKAERQADTDKAYQIWLAKRQARLRRNNLLK